MEQNIAFLWIDVKKHGMKYKYHNCEFNIKDIKVFDAMDYGVDYEEVNKIAASLRFVALERAYAAGKVFDEITYYKRECAWTMIKNGEYPEQEITDLINNCAKNIAS